MATGTGVDTTGAFERRYPPLDAAETPPSPAYLGFTVLRGGVRISRPQNWRLRDGSNAPGQAFIQYISPNAYSFAIYERPEPPSAPWRDVMKHFESDVESQGAKILGRRVATATWNGQGRAYTIQRPVEAPKKPLLSNSREILLRGKNRIVLVQIVHEGDTLADVDDELMRVINTMELL